MGDLEELGAEGCLPPRYSQISRKQNGKRQRFLNKPALTMFCMG